MRGLSLPCWVFWCCLPLPPVAESSTPLVLMLSAMASDPGRMGAGRSQPSAPAVPSPGASHAHSPSTTLVAAADAHGDDSSTAVAPAAAAMPSVASHVLSQQPTSGPPIASDSWARLSHVCTELSQPGQKAAAFQEKLTFINGMGTIFSNSVITPACSTLVS